MKSDKKGWQHPGGKMLALGAQQLTDAELLAILIGAGIKGKPAETIAAELLDKHGSFRELAGQPFDNLHKVKGLKKVKTIRIAAAFEIARRIAQFIPKEHIQIRGFNLPTLPKISNMLFPAEYRLLPNVSEQFELEFAFYESKLLPKKEVIKRGGFFQSVNGNLTNHYVICSNNSPLAWEGRSELTKSYFKEGNFSTGYATHGLFPYRGKFHPQLVKGIMNLVGVKEGDTILDPMCGSGTLNVEAALIGVNSIGVDKNPFGVFMSKVKYESLKANDSVLEKVSNNAKDIYRKLNNRKQIPDGFLSDKIDISKGITLLAYLDAMGYARRCTKTIDVLFPKVLNRYIGQIKSFIGARNKLNLKIGKARFEYGDARDLSSVKDKSIDGIITSPPYSFAIDYADNDRPQLEFLGYSPEDLRNEMIGLQGKNIGDKLSTYFTDMNKVISEMARVLKKGKYAVIIIGSNDIQTGGIRLETEVEKMAQNNGFILENKINKPIKGMRNTMKDEFILFLRKKYDIQ
ncbi:MAG: DNA methyltransferase [Planctomycetota bacterium]|nr:DNA methyltransferase [Planctomycetota bacterium]